MLRELKNADEIRAEVERLVNANAEVRDDGEHVQMAVPVELRQPDSDGCNWTIDKYRGSPTYRSLVELTVAQVQRRWNLMSRLH
jgi:hypothetical protein